MKVTKMFNYVFILVLLVFVLKTCQSQDYDDVDYTLREENPVSVESRQVDAKDKTPKTKSPRLKQVTNEEVDLSNEIETMMNEITNSVAGAKKHKHLKTCPPGHELRDGADDVTERIKIGNGRKLYKTDKNYDSDETKVAIHIQNKYVQREEKSEEDKVVKSPKHRVKTEVSKHPVMSDFHERGDYYSTIEPINKPCKHSEQSGSHEQFEELIQINKHNHNHVEREDHKTKEAKSAQISQHSNDYNSDTNKPHKTAKDRGNIRSYQNSEETESLKSRKSEQNEHYKSAEEKLATICENCKKYQVEPYMNPKEAISKQTKLGRNKNGFENKEEKSFESKTNVLANTKKNKDRSHEEMEKSEEMKSVKPCQHDIDIGRRGRTKDNEKDLKPRKRNRGIAKTVEIEISKSKPYKHNESSEEHERNKPCRHIPERLRHEDESVEISETQQDCVEHIGQADDANTQNATGSEESKDNVEVTTEEAEEKTKTVVSYPFSVSIQKKGAHFATGALLDKNWILTVAGEFYNVRESIKLYKARLGSVNCKRGGTLVALKRIEIHPRFVSKSPNFDIALIMIAKPVEFNDMIKPIGLSGIKTEVISAKFMTTYWSRVIIKGKVLPVTANERIKQTSLRVSTQKLIPWDWCDTLIEMGNATLKPSTLCLRPIESHHSLCTPDAGAPVVAEDGLWGITSGWTSKNCPSSPSPTVFTRVSSLDVRTWLEANLNRKV